MTVLPLTYLAPVEHFARLLRGGCVVDLGEHYVKRTERNRACILAADGPMTLTVPLVRANRPRQPMRDMRIDYSRRWQHLHWGALNAAYRSSPYFDHYAARFEPFYRTEYRYLVDYDLALLELLLGVWNIPAPSFSECYVGATEEDLDLRPKHGTGPDFVPEPYVQVFADRMPFVPNLSAADLLFAEGPAARTLLERCLPAAPRCR